MRALLAVAALARAAVVNVSFSRGGAWSPSPLEACVYEPHHLKSGKIHHICHCEQGTWTPTVGGNATRFAEDACGLLRSERFHFLGDSIVEQIANALGDKYLKTCRGKLVHNEMKRATSCSLVNYVAHGASWGGPCLAKALLPRRGAGVVLLVTSGAAHTVHEAPLTAAYAAGLAALRACNGDGCDRAAPRRHSTASQRGAVVDAAPPSKLHDTVTAYAAQLRDVAGAPARGASSSSTRRAGEHCENVDVALAPDADREKFAYSQYGYHWHAIAGVNAIFAEIMATTFSSSPVPPPRGRAAAKRERAHTGHFGLTRDTMQKPSAFGDWPDCVHWCGGPLTAYADLVLGGLRAIRAVARA
ncbi:hypothetical protein JL720_4419 [Aureococcus anophagefferens]|nr:hypothetical protein JL720_4419 [Aureococcus anophagefferens]